MKFFLQIALALLALSTTQCATQTAAQTLAPTARAPIDDAFAAIASQVRNPCKNIPEKASLLGALQSDRVCYEASILADDIVFFKSQGLNADQTTKMIVAEYESIVAPHAFRTDGRPRMGNAATPPPSKSSYSATSNALSAHAPPKRCTVSPSDTHKMHR